MYYVLALSRHSKITGAYLNEKQSDTFSTELRSIQDRYNKLNEKNISLKTQNDLLQKTLHNSECLKEQLSNANNKLSSKVEHLVTLNERLRQTNVALNEQIAEINEINLLLHQDNCRFQQQYCLSVQDQNNQTAKIKKFFK